MAFDGNGVFVRLYNWVNDAAANIKIRADRMDNEMNGFATGLSTCITKDGQTTITADLPMAGYRHTNVGVGNARTQYTRLDQSQDGKLNWADGGGTSDAITATYSPAITALVDGQECYVRATAANTTTTPTFSPNSLTARTIVKNGGQALAVGDIKANYELELRYNLANTRWEWMNFPTNTLSIVSDSIQTSGTSGVVLKNSAGTTAATFGSFGSVDAQIGGTITCARFVDISANSTEAAYVRLAEDTDNGTNKVKLQAPSSIGSDYTVTLPSTSGTLALSSEIVPIKLLHIQDQKSAGNNGGTATSGSWQTRTLNTEVTDEIGSTLSSNEFTLPAGTYFIMASAPATRCNQHQARLYNVTDAAVVLYGTSETTSSTAATGSNSLVNGRFTIAGTKTFRIEHRVSNTQATNGYGEANNFGGTEIYTNVMIFAGI